MGSDAEPLALYATPPHPCSYLPGRDAVTLFVDPARPKSRALHTWLSSHGFRRSGEHIYRPRCPGCEACVPVRVPVAAFVPRRSQRRAWKRNRDLQAHDTGTGFSEEHFELYRRYLASRHRGGGMDNPSPGQYRRFLSCAWAETRFVEFRDPADGNRAVAVAVMDRLDDALSAVYTFFDPELEARSLGVYAILWQVAEARRLGLRWLYLGYWIEACAKMRYKGEFLPQERLVDGRWSRAGHLSTPGAFGQTNGPSPGG